MTPNDPTELDPHTARRIRLFSDQALTDFDADAVANAAVRASGRPSLHVIGTIAAGAIVAFIGVAAVSGGVRDDRLSLNAGNSTPSSTGMPPESTTLLPSATATTESAAAMSTPYPSAEPSPPQFEEDAPLTETLAIAAAQAGAPQAAEWPVLVAKSGTAQALLYDEGGYQVAFGLSSDRIVWVVVFGESRATLDAEGVIVVLDALTGEVLDVVDWIS